MKPRLAILLLAAAALVARVTAGCTPVGQRCYGNRACCSGNCNRTCKPCLPTGAVCTDSSTCCSKSCLRGRCAPPCKQDGVKCFRDSDCCRGSCNSNTGKCGCVPRGQACGAGKTGKCCEGARCNGKKCVPCAIKGGACDNNEACCAGICNPYVRPKTCVDCEPVGRACTPDKSKLCCSGACNPLLKMCWPKQCATGEGVTCKQDVDCCSNRCVGGTCANCIWPGIMSQQTCTADAECCGGGRASCDTALKKCCISDDVGGCTKDQECCNGNCVAGTCGPKGRCQPVGYTCLENNDCCSQSCDSKTKKCACLAEGKPCTTDAVCCGKLCNTENGTCGKACIARSGSCDPAAPNCCRYNGCDANQGNTCQAVCRKENEPCADPDDELGCCTGLWCNFAATCVKLGAIGDECTAHMQCASEFCKIPPPTPPNSIGKCAPKE